MTTEPLNCADCKFSALIDNGYSNYTVEGTDLHCMIDKHPDAPFDHWYGGDVKAEFAEECGFFQFGDGLVMDVEFENEDDIDPEHVEWWEKFKRNEV